MSVSETNTGDINPSNIKLELPEDIWATNPSTEITLSPNKLKDINTLEVKTELFEENCSTGSSTATIILPDTNREDTGTYKVKVELPEEGCATVPSTLITSSSDEPNKDTSTLDVKLEFTEHEYSTILSSPKVEQPDISCVCKETNTFNIKKEISENHYSTVPTRIFFLPEDLKEEYSQLNKRIEFPDQDWSTVPVTTTSLPDLIKEHTRAVKVELAEEICTTAPSDKIITSPNKQKDIGTLDIKVEFTEQGSFTIPSTQTSLPDTDREDKEIPEEVAAPVPLTQISCSPEKPEDTDSLDVPVEITEQESSTVLSTPIVSLADTTKGDTSSCNFFSEKRCSIILTPIIFLPDDLGEDISKLHNRIEFADQDWSTIPSKSLSLRRQDSISRISATANSKNETRQCTSQESSMKEAQNPKMSSNKFIPQAWSMKSTQHTVLNVSSAYNSSFGRKLPIQTIKERAQAFPIKTAQSIVPSTPNISFHGHKHVSGMSIATSSIKKNNQLLPQRASNTGAQSIIPWTLKQPLPVQKNINVTSNAPLVQKLSCNSKRKKAKLIAHGVPEEIAIDLCRLPLPEILEKIPSLKPVLQHAKQESHTPAINGSKSAAIGTAPVGMESELKNPPVNRTDTALLRVGIQNSKPMDKYQMAAVHRHLVLVISEVENDGGGPEFLDFKQMDGWIMITCVDQRSRAWLIEEVKYLEPWPGAQLSIIPDYKLPQPSVAKVVAYIPESEAATVKEALGLLRAQNKGLNTEMWKILNENLECGKSWTVTFIIDEQSLEIIRAQDCRAAIGFKMMIFKIIPAAEISSTNSIPYVREWQHKHNFKSSSHKTTNSADFVQPMGTGAGTNSVESQTLKSEKRHQFVQGEGAVSKRADYYSGSAYKKSDGDDAKISYVQNNKSLRSKQPSSLTEPGRPMPQYVGDTQSAIQNSKSGKTLPQDSRQGEPCEDTALITSGENIIHAARVRFEELKQKTQTEKSLSDQNRSRESGPTSKWDQPPTRHGRQGPLDTRDKNRDRTFIENSKRWREETSMTAGRKRFMAARDRYIDRHGSETRTVNPWSNKNFCSGDGGYKSWIIQDAESFANSAAERSAVVPDSGPHSSQTKTRYVSPLGDGPTKPSFAHDTNSKAYSDRLYQDSYGRRAYDRHSPVKSDGRPPRARSNNTWNVDGVEKYQRNLSAGNTSDMDISSRQDRNKSDIEHERSWSATEERNGRNSTSRQDKSPHVRSSSRDWGIEDANGDRRRRIGMNEGDKRDRPLGHERSNYKDQAINSELFESHGRNRREELTDRDTLRSERRPQIRSGCEYRDTQNSFRCDNSSRDRFIRHQPTAGQNARERDGYPRDRQGFTRESSSTGHQQDTRRPEVWSRQ